MQTPDAGHQRTVVVQPKPARVVEVHDTGRPIAQLQLSVGNAVDDAVGDQVLEGAPDCLTTDLIALREIDDRRQGVSPSNLRRRIAARSSSATIRYGTNRSVIGSPRRRS